MHAMDEKDRLNNTMCLLTHTVGSAIDVPLVKNPTKEQIVALHEKYVKAVVDLYNKYKHKYSEFPECEIKIVWMSFLVIMLLPW